MRRLRASLAEARDAASEEGEEEVLEGSIFVKGGIGDGGSGSRLPNRAPDTSIGGSSSWRRRAVSRSGREGDGTGGGPEPGRYGREASHRGQPRAYPPGGPRAAIAPAAANAAEGNLSTPAPVVEQVIASDVPTMVADMAVPGHVGIGSAAGRDGLGGPHAAAGSAAGPGTPTSGGAAMAQAAAPGDAPGTSVSYDDTVTATITTTGPSVLVSRAGGDAGDDAGPGGDLAAPLDRDADVSQRILELEKLRDAELLLYDAGRWFRSHHCAALLCRLPELDLEDTNSGPRTRELLRILTRGIHADPRSVPGTALARTVGTYARLCYAPPESVPQICSYLLSYNARKLRSCRGPDVADLAWGLGMLQVVYGEIHLAVRRPWFNARLDPSARVVGYVKSGSGAEGKSGSEAALDPRTSGSSEAPAVLQKDRNVAALGTAAGEGPAATEAHLEAGQAEAEAGHPAGSQAAEVAVDGEAAAIADEGGAGRRRQRQGRGKDARAGAVDAARPRGSAEPDSTTGAAPSVAVHGPEEAESGQQSSGGSGSSGPGGDAALRAAREGGDGDGDGGGPRPTDLVWVVPGVMGRMWERLAVVAGTRAVQGEMEGEHLAKVAWAYAKAGTRNPRLFEQLTAATLTSLEPFLAKVESVAAGSAGTAKAGALVRRGTAGSAVASISSASAAAAAATSALALESPPLDPTSATNLAWGPVRLGHHSPRLLAALAAVVVPYKGLYDNDQLATVAQSYAAAGHYDGPLCTALAMVLSRRFRHLSASELTALVVSLAALGHRDDRLAAAGSGGLAAAIVEKQRELSAEQVCDLLWACAHLGLDAPLGTATPPGSSILGLSPFTASSGAGGKAAGRAQRHRTNSTGGAGAASALATCLRGRCDGLPPEHLAKALWALSLLPLRDDPRLRSQLVSELSRELAKHPPESFGGPEGLAKLYGAAQVLAEVMPLAAGPYGTAEAEEEEEAQFVVGAAAEDIEGLGEEEEEAEADSAYDEAAGSTGDSDLGPESGGFRFRAKSDDGVGLRRVSGRVGMVSEPGRRERDRLFGAEGAAAAAAGYCTVATTTERPQQNAAAGGPSGDVTTTADNAVGSAAPSAAAEASSTMVVPQSDASPKTVPQSTSTRSPRMLAPAASGKQPDSGLQRRRHRQRTSAYNPYSSSNDPYDSSWSDIDWDNLQVPPPSARARTAAEGHAGVRVPAAGGIDAGADGAAGDGSVSDGGRLQRPQVPPRGPSRHPSRQLGGKTIGHDPAAADDALLDPLAYDVRQVYDDALGRDIWEVLPRGLAAAAGGAADEDPAARVLPARLLAACREAAAEWSEEEVLRLRALEATDAELWRLEVGMALRELTGQEPQPHWPTRHRTAVADLLVVPPADTAGPAGTSRGSLPPPPVAVLLLGPADTTRSSPFVPLGPARLRARLLEASGARVVVLPRFLWRLMGATVDEQLCLLGNLLGGRGQG